MADVFVMLVLNVGSFRTQKSNTTFRI